MRVLISGGGTGGHIFPAIAIADEVKRQQPDVEILFVGAEGKMEMERVPKAGYEIVGLPVVGFHRSLTLRNIRRNLAFPFKLWKSMQKAKAVVKKFKPDVAVGVGGYASGPVVRAAMKLGVKGLIQEQNSYAGVTNKLLSKNAAKICVAYEGMEAYFPKEKIVLTGNPVRQDIQDLDDWREDGIQHFGLDKRKKTILILGGSLGARTLNQAMRDNVEFFKKTPVQVLWQCGKLYYEEYSKSETAKDSKVHIRAFLDRMDLAYAVADVVIARAGALTVSELCLARKASILVPSPNVAEDHQTKNAMALVKKGAAIIVKDAEAKELMLGKAKEVLDNEAVAKDLKANISALAKPNATEEIARIVLGLGRGGKQN